MLRSFLVACALLFGREAMAAPHFLATVEAPSKGPLAPKAQPLKIKALEFEEFSDAPLKVQEILREASVLIEKNLPYKYGVADPDRGFDCSGFVFYVLKENKARHVPRQANMFHQFVVDKKAFRPFRNDPELEDLEVGDLLFWSGTYKIDRNITHVMFYLGTDRKTGERWMIGASTARRGIGVFKFDPRSSDGLGKHFAGYGKTSAFFPESHK